MQTSGLGSTIDAAVEDAVNASERQFVVEIKVDWLRNGSFSGHTFSDLSNHVESVSLDKALAGSAPAELMLVEGSAAAELTINLGGEYLHPTGVTLPLTAVFSPYNGLSPLYQLDPVGAEITYRLGIDAGPYGVVWYPQFIGNVRTIRPNRRDNTVQITALDRAELMRQPVSLPVWAISQWQANRGYYEAQMSYSHWVIDQCLKTANISTSPSRPPTAAELYSTTSNHRRGLQVWISGNGSYIPNVGTLDNSRILGFPKPEIGGAIMYTHLGEAHPNVKTEVEASGKMPWTLSPTTLDATGVVPAQLAQSPNTSDTDGNRSYHLAYRVARMADYDSDKNGTHWIGFRLIQRGDGGYWSTVANYIALEAYVGWNMVLRIRLNAGQVRAELYDWVADSVLNATAYITIPTGATSIPIDAQMLSPVGKSGIRKIGIRAGATFGSWTALPDYAGTYPDDARGGVFNVNHKIAMQDIYWTNLFIATSGMSDSDFKKYGRTDAKYAAVLDTGKNMLSTMPQTTYEDGWELAGAVASAEFGAVFWDEVGVFRFWNRDTIVNKQDTIVKTITLDDAQDLEITNSSDSVRNIITLDNQVAMADADLLLDVSDPEQYYLNPGSNVDTTVSVSDNTIQAVQPGKVRRYATSPDTNVPNKWTDDVQFGYVVQFLDPADNTWKEQNNFVSGVDVLASSDGSGNLVVRFHNGYNRPARMLHLRITGTRVFKQSNIQVSSRDDASVNKFGARNLSLSGDWVQSQYNTAEPLGSFVLGRTKAPIPTTDNIVVAGDPRLQLGDCIEVQDPDGFGESIKLQVLGLTRSYSEEDGLTDTLTVEMIQAPKVGIWDSPTYGLWDSTFIWSD